MKDIDLQALADGVRGSSGKVTIPLHQAKELKLKTIEVLKNGSSRVNCEELVKAIDTANPSPKEDLKADKNSNGKPTTTKKN